MALLKYRSQFLCHSWLEGKTCILIFTLFYRTCNSEWKVQKVKWGNHAFLHTQDRQEGSLSTTFQYAMQSSFVRRVAVLRKWKYINRDST